MADTTGATSAPPSHDGAGRLPLVLLAAVLTALVLAWVAASPPGGAPDEEAHVVYAWGVADGSALRQPVVPRSVSGEGGLVFPTVRVDLPAGMVRLIHSDCFAFQPERPASDCTDRLGPAGGPSVSQLTYMARYPPAYYLPIGLVLRAGASAGLDGPSVVLLARAASGLWSVGFLLLAAALLRRVLSGPAVVAVVLLAAVPMALFVSAAVNPNGLEVAVTVALSAAVVVVRHGARTDRAAGGLAITGMAVAAPVLALVRPTSVVWLGVLMAALLLPVHPADGGTRWPVTRVPRALVAWVALWMLAGLAWLAWAAGRGLGWADSLAEPWAQVPWPERVLLVTLRYGGGVLEYVGVFGWLDTPLPQGLAGLWVVATGALLALAVAGGWRGTSYEWVVGSLVAGAGMLVIGGHTLLSGFGWQPRYVLPVLAAGLVVGAGALCEASPAAGHAAAGPRRVLLAATGAAVLVHAVAPLWTYSRYRWGFSQPSNYFPPAPVPREVPDGVDALWAPVVGPWGLVVLVACVCALGVSWVIASARQAGGGQPDPAEPSPREVSVPAPGPATGSARTRSSGWPRRVCAARRR